MRFVRIASLFCAAVALVCSQQWPPGAPGEARRLPDGKSQQEEILKDEHAKTLKDAGRLVDLAEQLKAEIEKNERHVLSVSTLKKAEEVEKLAERIRERLKRF